MDQGQAAQPRGSHVAIERDPRGVATVAIHDAGRLNILSSAVMRDVTAAITALSQDPELRALVLRGSGDAAFVAGADVHEMVDLDEAGATAFITGLYRLCESVRNCPVPVIARLSGWCVGGGMELAAACDVRIAAQEARFSMPEVRIGMPSIIHAALLPRVMNETMARWLLLSGETIDAAEALRAGFLTRMVPQAELDKAIEAAVKAILACGPGSVRVQKQLLEEWSKTPLDEALSATIPRFAEAYATGEPQRFMRNFLASRKGQ